jgi:predicted membrane channel-forming protein YqfA (hemolysin III family)
VVSLKVLTIIVFIFVITIIILFLIRVIYNINKESKRIEMLREQKAFRKTRNG